MLDHIVVEPMTKDFLLWRCLHGGPLTTESINRWKPEEEAHWTAVRACHLRMLEDLTQAYGACAIVARDGDKIAGTLRFYPKPLMAAAEGGAFCLQPFPPNPHKFLETGLPSLGQFEDKTLQVHCLMAGSPFQEENPYQRKGIGSRMVRELMRWAKEKGWEAIEANATEDLSILYENTGMAGKSFWDKLGFSVAETSKSKRGSGWLPPKVLEVMFEQAAAAGLDPEVSEGWRMRFDLK